MARFSRELPAGREVEFFVDGVHCAACLWLLEKLPTLLTGVSHARLNYADARLTVRYEPSEVSLGDIARKLDSLGYLPHVATSNDMLDVGRDRTRAERALLVRMGVAGAAFGNVMLASVALYSGDAYGMSDETVQLFRWLSWSIAVPCTLWSAWPFFRGALTAIRTRTAHMDLPISLGILAALVTGTVATFRAEGEIYFDSVTMLVLLLLVGRWLQMKQQRVAARATDLLRALAPSKARLWQDGRVREIATLDVPVGALVELLPGQSVGVDAHVVEGESRVDQSLLSGESRPVFVGPGDEVLAGTVNLNARLLVRTSVPGTKTRLAHIVEELNAAAQYKSDVTELANRLSSYFLAVVLLLAVGAFLFWLPNGWVGALEIGATVLIVTCPCALGLATPLLTSVAVGQAARRGLLVKGGKYLEQLTRPALVVLDKTGTLTEGRLTVTRAPEEPALLGLIQAAEAQSRHPVAEAIRALPQTGELPVVERCVEELGQGVVAQVGGHSVAVGRSEWVRRALRKGEGAAPTEAQLRAHPEAVAVVARGESPVFVAVDGELATVLGIGDALRPEARRALEQFIARGHELAILSGDHPAVVAGVAATLGLPLLEVRGRCSPEDKLEFVRKHSAHRPVIMVGDGVNDAAALTAAHVGIAVHGGAEASLAAADVFATRAGLAPLVELLLGSHRTLSTIRQNLAFSLGYNLLAAALAVSGHISPLWAAILMPLSSLSVLANSLRARLFKAWNMQT